MSDTIWIISSYRPYFESTLTEEGWFDSAEAAQTYIDTHLAIQEVRRYDEYLARINSENASAKRAATIANKELAALQASGLRKGQSKTEPQLTTPMSFRQWIVDTDSATYEPVEVTRAHRTHV